MKCLIECYVGGEKNTPSIEIKTRFRIKTRIGCQNLCVSFYLCWKIFFYHSVLVSVSLSFDFPSLRDPVEFICFSFLLLLFFHIAHFTRPFKTWAATITESKRKKYRYRTRKIDVVEQNRIVFREIKHWLRQMRQNFMRTIWIESNGKQFKSISYILINFKSRSIDGDEIKHQNWIFAK